MPKQTLNPKMELSSAWRLVCVAGPQLHLIVLATVALGLSSWAQLEVPSRLGVYLKALESESSAQSELATAPEAPAADSAVWTLIWLMVATSALKSMHEVLMTVAGERVTVAVRGRLFSGLIRSSMAEVWRLKSTWTCLFPTPLTVISTCPLMPEVRRRLMGSPLADYCRA